ncbi:MAG: sodium-translocating pyrophosphatase [Candidatus Methanomethylophilaceae archaeon]|jgi:K(+)-stimulated pyrophosphate-energized sodium pump|nr:sodium-translocating pyrophosphatase [Candidatus Methanomethylophilaceae archaeon]MDD2779347.1 sodium-translocating pyrophosphatase [Candidatus Methanomethylophilaceae archaeon]MDD3128584.1 sodium-translocating pyrophosphatase [Candidatus Methanomethylophilaceae archaeon]MDD4119330.1 sodium-translocating pyrophosphatase [Candidatus Methanomethylophilaceae archaeon]MDD4454645.1 sodium-translocating pyrophosphatase [Candidatus Methanomethylophilaceae archaeon]
MIEITTENLLFMIPVAVLIAVLFALYFHKKIMSMDKGTPEMQKISDAIETGAMAYLRRQYKTIGIISVIIAVLLALGGLFESTEDYLGYKVAIAFLIGAGFSILSGYIGMRVSVKANIRTANAARTSLGEAFKCSFRGGAISGIAVSALSLGGLFVVFYLYYMWIGDMTQTLHSVVGYAFGASFAALFAQLGGGIYTKAADVGADLVGKVEAGIPEDDPRNPAVIADLVGDNVGDCAGRGADIFESTAAEIIGSMVIGLAVMKAFGSVSYNWIFLPLVIIAFGLIFSLIGISVVRIKDEDADVSKELNKGYYLTIALVIVGLIISTYVLLEPLIEKWFYYVFCGIFGIALGLAIVFLTQYYTGDHKPVKSIAEASETGPATNIITGISVGLESTVMPVVCIVVAIIGTFLLGYFASPVAGQEVIFGLYGTAIGTIAMLGSSAFILAEDTFGPITDNAGGIVEMSNQPEEIRNRTDKLDSAGNTTKALTKGYAMGSAALAAFLLFAAYFEIIGEIQGKTIVEVMNVNLGNPLIFAGGLIGGVLVFFFASLAIRAVGTAAGEMIEEVRRQFREDPGIMEGTSDPDYAQCVDIATRGALRAMVAPALLPIVVPVAFGLIYRFVLPAELVHHTPEAVGGLIMVGTIVGILMANFLNNGGGAWDNAKKFIESGRHGGKNSPAHAAAVVGDTVGDPFKDTAGPSIHVLVKLLATICLVTAVLYVPI